MDFSYFKIAEAQEQRIENNEVSCTMLFLVCKRCFIFEGVARSR